MMRAADTAVRTAACSKATVVFAGARDEYQLALALGEGDLLDRLVTEWYWPADRMWFRHTVAKLLPATVLAARFTPTLSSSKVRVSIRAAGAFMLGKVFPVLRTNRAVDRALGDAARRRAFKARTPVLSCSYYAGAAFDPKRAVPDQRFIFQIHPHPRSVRSILLEELSRTPQARASLLREEEIRMSPAEFDGFAAEPHLANGWIVASTFTRSTLVQHGIPDSRIHVVPYGIDVSQFPARAAYRPKGKLKVVFLGSLVQRKGLSYLFEAVRQLSSRHVEVVLCGRGFWDKELIAHYGQLPVTLRLGLNRQRVVTELHAGDIFVLPSLAEGFGHVVLQAMAAGLPVLTTPNTCGPDVVREGVDGFIVPVRDSDAIAARLAWALEHRSALMEMGHAAAVQGRQFSWDRFRHGVRSAYTAMLGQATLPHSDQSLTNSQRGP
jgi:glycosyltransferase involved in cell wall biosynthesis